MIDLLSTFQAQVAHGLAQLFHCTDDEVGIQADSKLNANAEAGTVLELGDRVKAAIIRPQMVSLLMA